MSLGRQWSNMDNVQQDNPKQSQTRDLKKKKLKHRSDNQGKHDSDLTICNTSYRQDFVTSDCQPCVSKVTNE